jgi:hypothetical protein
MRWSSVAVALIVATAFLSGCSGGEDGGTATSTGTTTGTATTGTGGTTGPGTSGGTTAPPHTHAVTLAANATAGQVPVAIRFQLGADTDEPATWTLDFGDGSSQDGEGFPAEATHNYTVEGNRTVTLRAAFVDGATGTATLNLTLAPGQPGTPTRPSGTVLGVQTISRTATIGPFAQGAGSCGSTEGTDQLTYALPFNATYGGYLAQVTHAGFNLTMGAGNVDSDLFFLDPAGDEIAHSTNFNSPAPTTQTAGPLVVSPDEKIRVDQAFPSGVYSIQVKACTTGSATFTLTGYWVYTAP